MGKFFKSIFKKFSRAYKRREEQMKKKIIIAGITAAVLIAGAERLLCQCGKQRW